MNYQKQLSTLLKAPLLFTFTLLITLIGCSSDDDEDGTGYFQLYNSSSSSPVIHLTIDQLDNDDFTKRILSGVKYTNVSSRIEYEIDTYDIELAWQDEDSDLEVVHERQITIKQNNLKFIVLAGDIKTPHVQVYDIPVRDDDEKEEDLDNDEFNIRFVNIHSESSNVDIYLSESNQTFNEAQLIAQSSFAELTDNQKIEQNDYIIYITAAGSDEVLYNSKEISFPYAAEYIIAIRENKGAGDSPFVIDRITTSSITEYADANSEASFRLYNGIIEHELLPNYQGLIDLHIDGVDDTAELSNLAFGQFSDVIQTNFGDYSISLVSFENKSPIIENHLLTLNENSDKTIFFYLTEDNVDLDGDGDVDEDGDGYVDEIEISVNSLVVNNSQNESIYTHEIKIINLIDSDDFSSVSVYFVRSDEIIDTAEKSTIAPYISPQTTTLINNTYSVYIISLIKSTHLIISSSELILNEDSRDQFLILETDSDSATGYKMTFTNQLVD